MLQFGRGNPSELQIACFISLGFGAFLRWDDLKDLKRHNLCITSDHMSITLTKRKNDQFREGSLILVARTGSRTCPVSMTERFLLFGQHKETDYLFRKICHTKHGFSFRQQRLSYSRATELVKNQLKAIGLDPSQYGLHSLRSGGASSAAAAAIRGRLLKCIMVAGDLRQQRTCISKKPTKSFSWSRESSVCETDRERRTCYTFFSCVLI